MANTEMQSFSCNGLFGTAQVAMHLNLDGQTRTYIVVSYVQTADYNPKQPSSGHPFQTPSLQKANAEYTARIDMVKKLVGAPEVQR